MSLPPETRELLLLWSARESGALEALVRRAGTPDELAAETGLDPDAAERLVAALAARDFLREVGAAYEPTNRLLGFLATHDLRSVGDLPFSLDTLSGWVALPDTLAGADAPTPDTRHELGAEWKVEEATVRARVTAGEREAPAASGVVVLHDGPGRHAREFAARGKSVTVLDTAERLDPLGPLYAPSGIETVAGDPGEAIPDADLVFGVDLGTRYGPSEIQRVLAAARDAAPTIVLVERFREDAPLERVELLATGAEGDQYGSEAWADRLAEAGFDWTVEPVPGTHDSAVVGRAID